MEETNTLEMCHLMQVSRVYSLLLNVRLKKITWIQEFNHHYPPIPYPPILLPGAEDCMMIDTTEDTPILLPGAEDCMMIDTTEDTNEGEKKRKYIEETEEIDIIQQKVSSTFALSTTLVRLQSIYDSQM
jgi:hypothetical protein